MLNRILSSEAETERGHSDPAEEPPAAAALRYRRPIIREEKEMKILFAAPDRDLLECYTQLLTSDFGEIVTAFDGTQVLSLLSAERFDLVILDRDIPRIEHKRILSRIRDARIPAVLLTNSPVSARPLTEEPLPSAFLSYPFTPQHLADVLRDTLEKAASGQRMTVCGIGVDVAGFRFADGPSLCAREIDVWKALTDGAPVTTDDGAYISALNTKLARMGTKVKIRYKTGKGFALVNEDE